MDQLVAVVALIVLHNVDGAEVLVNAQQIVALTQTNEGGAGRSPANTIIAKGHRCVIALTNGKFVSVKESCDDVVKSMQGLR